MTKIFIGSRRARLGLLLLPALPACGGPDLESVEAITSALVVTNCTGQAISAAVAAGGDVVLDCGPSPVTITVPFTTVTLATRLRTAVPGLVTLTHNSGLFAVGSGVFFEVDNLRFQGQPTSSIALHAVTGRITVAGSTFTGYRSFPVSVHNNTVLNVTGSTFSFNGSGNTSFGSAIYNEGSQTTVADSTFLNNFSGGTGGAITSFAGTLNISGCTFVDNFAAAGGAIYVDRGSTTVTNSTFRTNRAATGAGGAVYSSGATPAFTNCTFADNFSPQGTVKGPVQFINSILVDRASPAGAPCSIGGFGNIEWPATLSNCGAGFRYGDPLLGNLANNGGPTQTMALGVGSVAIDSALGACPSADQRHFLRPRDGDGNGSSICDVGAFER